MKTLNILWLLAGLTFFACEGPPGPRGADGFDGIDGLSTEEGYVFDYEFNFTSINNYSEYLVFPDNFEMLDTDMIMVYLLWDVVDGIEIWRAMPQTMYFSDGILAYNYDFTKTDVRVFLDGTVNLDGLSSDWTNLWVARVIVMPTTYAGRSTIDWKDYNQVKEYLNLSDSKLATPNYPSRPKL